MVINSPALENSCHKFHQKYIIAANKQRNKLNYILVEWENESKIENAEVREKKYEVLLGIKS